MSLGILQEWLELLQLFLELIDCMLVFQALPLEALDLLQGGQVCKLQPFNGRLIASPISGGPELLHLGCIPFDPSLKLSLVALNLALLLPQEPEPLIEQLLTQSSDPLISCQQLRLERVFLHFALLKESRMLARALCLS